MFTLRPKGYTAVNRRQHELISVDTIVPGFVIHPATSELAEMLTIDPQALNNENYSGIYDGTGDYIPQYCDDPEKIPRAAPIQANSDKPVSDSTSSDTSSKPTSSDTSSDSAPTELVAPLAERGA